MAKIVINVAGVEASPDGGGSFLDTGCHRLQIMAVTEKTAASSGRPQLELDLAGPEGKTKCWINLPIANDKAGVFKTVRNFMESVGYTAEELDGGEVELDTEQLVGREMLIHYVAGDQATGVKSQCTPMNPVAWEEEKATGARTNKAAHAAPAQTAAPAAPPPPKVAAPPAAAARPSVPPPRAGGFAPPTAGAGGPPAGGLAGLRRPGQAS